MIFLKQMFAVIFAFGSGVVISGGVFAFIAMIGIVPRLAQKTKTQRYARWYEEVIVIGGMMGTLADVVPMYVPIGRVLSVILSFCGGVFFGCLAMSLAEVLDVIPILARRIKVQKGMFFFVLCIAFGKLFGSLIYFIIPGFYKAH